MFSLYPNRETVLLLNSIHWIMICSQEALKQREIEKQRQLEWEHQHRTAGGAAVGGLGGRIRGVGSLEHEEADL